MGFSTLLEESLEGIVVEMNTYFRLEVKGLMGLNKPQKGYNGTVQVGNQQVQVQNGVTVLQGKKFFVSDKGQVTDETNQPVGSIQNGQFQPQQTQQGAPT